MHPARFVAALSLVFSLLPAQNPVRVAAAANLSVMSTALATAWSNDAGFRKSGKPPLAFVFGASGTLVTQISNGLPIDLFMSADTSFPAKLQAWGLSAGAPKVYAVGRLVLVNNDHADLGSGLAALAGTNVARFAMANPEIAPYGRAARQALEKSGLWGAVKGKAVYGQNITQTLQLTLGGTGLGFVAYALLFGKETEALRQDAKAWLLLDAGLHDPIEQSFVVVKGAEKNAATAAFASFLGAPAAKGVFKAFGFGVP